MVGKNPFFGRLDDESNVWLCFEDLAEMSGGERCPALPYALVLTSYTDPIKLLHAL
jgi:hypothetical protein